MVSVSIDITQGASLWEPDGVDHVKPKGGKKIDVAYLDVDSKVDAVAGKGLSTNDFTDDLETKLNDLPIASDLTNSLDGKVDKVTGKGLSTEDYTTTEKNKLNGIEAGANNYTHPANHDPSIITQDESNRFVSDTEKSTWNGKEDASNKKTTLADNSDTYYPSQKAVKTEADRLQTQIIEKTSYGVITGLVTAQQSTPNMTVKVSAGTIYMANGDRFTPVATASLAVTTADATNPRIDIVYVSSTGVVSYLAGTAGATPAQPATPAGGQLLATILVTAGKTSILTADITDKRRINLQGEWIVPTLLNSWVVMDTARTPMYMKDSLGFVHLKGMAKSGVVGSNMFVLASGYRPSATRYYAVVSNSAIGSLFIDSGGVVTLQVGSNVWMSLDGITFKAE